MAVLPVIKLGHPNLRKRAEEVDSMNKELSDLASDMIETMQVYNGIGLAGNQINVLKRIFVIDLSLIDETLEPQAYVNPKILESKGLDSVEEGCLSIPGINADVERADKLWVEYKTLEGELIQEELEGLHARVFQHELDHLNGVLFIDRIPPLQRKMLEPQLQKLLEANSLV
jgi:peptide deformylase